MRFHWLRCIDFHIRYNLCNNISGIGAGTAEHFASLGAKLALVARSKEKLEEVAIKCTENGATEVRLKICLEFNF